MLTPDGLERPRLLRDAGRLERQCVAMRDRCRMRGVVLRPHLKTAKSTRVACWEWINGR
jgi:D-serine deaminase-like pyridoxal phosphate-dependent protein